LPFTVWLVLGVVATALALFFGLTNSALRSFSRSRLEEALHQRGRLSELPRFYRHHEGLLQMARALHILSMTALTAIAEIGSVDRFGDTAAGWLVGAAIAGLLGVTLGGVVPMAWAKYSAERILVATLPTLHLIRHAFRPFHRALAVLDELVRRLVGVPEGFKEFSHIEEEIRSVVAEGEREGLLEKDQKDMIENVIRFRRSDVSQIMTPRTDIISIEATATTAEARTLVATSGHSRIPVTRGHLDTVVGILYAKDLLERACDEGADAARVTSVMRTPLFVPETKRLDELLRDFQGDKVHMAVVLDEYGGTAGLVTIEDIVEEIVGEIVDEYEQAPAKTIQSVAERSFEVDARTRIDELRREVGLELPESEDYETVGGFVLARLGAIPKAGETLQYEDAKITVLAAEERRVMRLRIDLPVLAEDAQAANRKVDSQDGGGAQ
jgi:CBS domain containing-hemolysin-like protein